MYLRLIGFPVSQQTRRQERETTSPRRTAAVRSVSISARSKRSRGIISVSIKFAPWGSPYPAAAPESKKILPFPKIFGIEPLTNSRGAEPVIHAGTFLPMLS